MSSSSMAQRGSSTVDSPPIAPNLLTTGGSSTEEHVRYLDLPTVLRQQDVIGHALVRQGQSESNIKVYFSRVSIVTNVNYSSA